MGKGTKRKSKTIEAWTVAAKKSAARMLQNHWLGDSLPRRNDLARTAWVARGGPSPAVHQRNIARKITSATAARGTPRCRRNSGHTLAATRATRRPERMARADVGSFAQGLGARSCDAMGGASEQQGDNTTL